MASYNESTSELRTNKKLLYDTTADRVQTSSGESVEDVLKNMDSNLGSHTHDASTINQDENNRFVSDVQIAKWNKGPLYTNSNKTIEDIGGAKKGSTFKNNTVQEVFDKILYPDRGYIIKTNFGSLKILNPMSRAITEISGSVEITAGSEKINRGPTIRVESYTITGEHKDFVFELNLDSDIEPGNTKWCRFTIPVQNLQDGGILDSDFQIFAEIRGATPEDQLSAEEAVFAGTFIFPYFRGVVDRDVKITADNFFSLGLSQKYFAQRDMVAVDNYTCENQRMVFALPIALDIVEYQNYLEGQVVYSFTKIIDENGMNLSTCFNKKTIEIEVAGYPIEYMIYYSDPCTVKNYAISFDC